MTHMLCLLCLYLVATSPLVDARRLVLEKVRAIKANSAEAQATVAEEAAATETSDAARAAASAEEPEMTEQAEAAEAVKAEIEMAPAGSALTEVESDRKVKVQPPPVINSKDLVAACEKYCRPLKEGDEKKKWKMSYCLDKEETPQTRIDGDISFCEDRCRQSLTDPDKCTVMTVTKLIHAFAALAPAGTSELEVDSSPQREMVDPPVADAYTAPHSATHFSGVGTQVNIHNYGHAQKVEWDDAAVRAAQAREQSVFGDLSAAAADGVRSFAAQARDTIFHVAADKARALKYQKGMLKKMQTDPDAIGEVAQAENIDAEVVKLILAMVSFTDDDGVVVGVTEMNQCPRALVSLESITKVAGFVSRKFAKRMRKLAFNSCNRIYGDLKIPQTQVEYVDFASTSVTGNINALKGLSKLNHVNLAYNPNIVGTITDLPWGIDTVLLDHTSVEGSCTSLNPRPTTCTSA